MSKPKLINPNETHADRKKKYAEILLENVEGFLKESIDSLTTNHESIIGDDMVLVKMIIFDTPFDFNGMYNSDHVFTTRVPIVKVIDHGSKVPKEVVKDMPQGSIFRLASSMLAKKENVSWITWSMTQNEANKGNKSSGRIAGTNNNEAPQRYTDSFQKTLMPRVFYPNPFYPMWNSADMFLLPISFLNARMAEKQVLSAAKDYVALMVSK